MASAVPEYVRKLQKSSAINHNIFRHLRKEVIKAQNHVSRSTLATINFDTANKKIDELRKIESHCWRLLSKEDHQCIEAVNITRKETRMSKMKCTNCLYYYNKYETEIKKIMYGISDYNLIDHPDCYALQIYYKQKFVNTEVTFPQNNTNNSNPSQILDLDDLEYF